MNNRGYGREILMPDDFEPSQYENRSPIESDQAQMVKAEDTTAIKIEPSLREYGSESTMSSSDFNTEEWTSFMTELKSYDPTKRSREERLVCRIDRDLSESIDDIEIFGYSRPDIVSAIVRTFFKRHLSKLMEMRRIKKSIFPPLTNVCQ